MNTTYKQIDIVSYILLVISAFPIVQYKLKYY